MPTLSHEKIAYEDFFINDQYFICVYIMNYLIEFKTIHINFGLQSTDFNTLVFKYRRSSRIREECLIREIEASVSIRNLIVYFLNLILKM